MNTRTRRRLILSGSILAAVVVVAVGAFALRAWYRAHQITEGRRIGLALFADGDFPSALAHLSIAARDASDAEVVLALADCRRAVPQSGMRHLKYSANLYRSVLTRDPTNERAQLGALECAIGLGHLADIPEIASSILTQNPKNVRALESTLEVHAALGHWAQAVEVAERLQAIEPDEIRWKATQLHCLAASGADADGRLALARRWLQESPDSEGVSILVADTLHALGRMDEARELLKVLASRGTRDARVLEALLESLEAMGLSQHIDQAIAASSASLADPILLTEIEGERLLRAGRLKELRIALDELPTAAGPLKSTIFRLRFALEYLEGHADAVRACVAVQDEIAAPGATKTQATIKVQDSIVAEEEGAFLEIAHIHQSDAPLRERINDIQARLPQVSGDAIASIMLADLFVEAGELDEALSLVTRAFDASLRRSQPSGLRAVHLCVLLSRIPDALSVARDLGLRYQSDGAVAIAILRAWATALEAGYIPSRVYGALGTDSPENLAAYWESMNRPPELAPLVAEVFARRGQAARAKELIEELLRGEGSAEALLRVLSSAQAVSSEFGVSTLENLAARSMTPSAALELARNFERLNRTRDALQVLDRGAVGASESDARRIERQKRVLSAIVDGSQSGAAKPAVAATVEWLREELKANPGIDSASFVLARPEVWSTDPSVAGANAELIALAVDALKTAGGNESQRAIVAEATLNLVFHPTDAARMASSLIALAAAERKAPQSVSVLTTLARLHELDEKPDLARAAELLSRAVQLQPGAVELYADLARVLQQMGDYTAAGLAIDSYARLVGEGDVQGMRLGASIQESLGRFEEAATMHAQLAHKTRDVVDQLAVIRAKIRAGKGSDAITELRALAGSTANAMVLRELALLLAGDGQLDEARRVLSEAPAQLKLHSVRAEIEATFGDSTLALEAARAAARTEKTVAAELLLARILLQVGETAQAREVLIAAIERSAAATNILPLAAAMLVGDVTEDGRKALHKALAAAPSEHADLVAAIELLDSSSTADGLIVPDVQDLRIARELTVRYSASSLCWRLAAQLHAQAGDSAEAARLALMARSRLPNDESIAALAVSMCIEAGRLDDAAAGLGSWKHMVGADVLAADTAGARVYLLQRLPQRAWAMLLPHVKAIMAQTSAREALALFVSSAVLSGKAESLATALAGIAPDRRSDAIGAWLQAAQVLPRSEAALAITAAAAFRDASDPTRSDTHLSSCVAMWTALCAEGDTASCASASAGLAVLGDGGIPKSLLLADLSAARGETSEATRLYEALSQPVTTAAIGATTSTAGAGDPAQPDFTALASALGSDEARRKRCESQPAALAAMNNLAEMMLKANIELPRALALARCVDAILPGAAEVTDTLVRALRVNNELSEAQSRAESNPDPLLGAIGLAEVEVARGRAAAAAVATARADLLLARVPLPPRVLVQRISDLRRALRSLELSSERTSGSTKVGTTRDGTTQELSRHD